MRICIVGAGFTGLSAAIELLDQGHEVVIYEAGDRPGGLALGFKKKGWEWSLEQHYHHIFTSDIHIRRLAERFNVDFRFTRPITSSFIENIILQLDSPLKLLQFSRFTIWERLRMGLVLAYLRYIARWQDLEQYTAHEWLQKKLGLSVYQLLWEPLLKAKFGAQYQDISLAWFWARIKARSTELGYPEGGFQHLADILADHIESNECGRISYSVYVQQISQQDGGVDIVFNEKGVSKKERYDKVLLTIPNTLASKMIKNVSVDYSKKLQSFQSLGAINLILEMKKSLLSGRVYWLNICDTSFPFLAVVEHTHFINKKHYGGKHIVYIGAYLPANHRFFQLSPEQLFAEYMPYLQKFNPDIKGEVLDVSMFKTPFAQPIVTTNFSKKILPISTPDPDVFLANMQQVYPWDRGTNFAVELGQRAAKTILSNNI